MTDVTVAIHRIAKRGDVARFKDIQGDHVMVIITDARAHSSSFRAMINADVRGGQLVSGSAEHQRVHGLFPAVGVGASV